MLRLALPRAQPRGAGYIPGMTAPDRPDAAVVARFARDRLLAVLARPDGWGPPEAIEAQVLLLVDVQLVAYNESDRVDGIPERFAAFRARHGVGGSLSLAGVLGEGLRSSARFTGLLAAFVDEEMRALTPQVDLFAG